MKTRKRVTKFTAAIISLVMIFSIISPMSAFAAVSIDPSKFTDDTILTSKTDYAVAPGIEETHFTINNKEGSDQNRGYAMTIELGGTASLIASYKNQDGTVAGMQTVRDQAAAAESKRGYNVVGGVNGDFYNMQTGAPTGVLVMEGNKYYNGNGVEPYFAILKDGKAVIRNANESTADVKEAIGLNCIIVKDGKNIVKGTSSYETTNQPRTAVGIKADGSVVLLTVDGRQAPASAGVTYSELANLMMSLGCVQAANLDGGGSATFLSQHEGEDGLVCRNSPSDGSERTVSSALLVVSSAKPTGVFDHASLLPNNEIYTPGTTVQFTATGVDSAGGAAELPADGTFALADDSFGTIDASGSFVSNGKEGTVVVNYMSGGQVCGEVSIEIRVPEVLVAASSEVSLGFEETTDFNITAQYQNREVNMKAGDIIWSITDDDGNDIAGQAGTFDGLTFTTFDGVTINANVKATLTFDENVTAEVRAIIGAMPVVLYDFEYTTDKAEAEANPDLEYVPSYVMPKYDVDQYSSSAAQAAVEYENGYPFLTWPNGALDFGKEYMTAEVVEKDNGDPVRFGDKSLKVTFDFSGFNNSSNANCYLRTTVPDYTFEGSPTAFGAWIYIPEGLTSALVLYLQVANKNGATSYGTVGTTLDWTGWKYVELDLTDATAGSNLGPQNAPYGTYQGNGILWISYQPGKYGAMTAASSIYIDNMQLVYGANTDDIDNPLISSIRTDTAEIENGVTVLGSNVNTFKASYADFDGKYATGINYDEVKMLIDGVDVTDKCYINEGDEEIYYYDAQLPNGTHSITVTVADLFGNSTTETRTFTVNGETEETQVSFVSVDAAPVLGADYTMAVTSENAADIASADVSVKIVSSFVNYWDEFNIVPGANYELEGEAYYDATNSTINFKAVRKADADPAADDGTIAKVVISIPADVPEGLQVTYRIDKGELTYNSEKPEKFIGGFFGSITTQCDAPLTVKPDVMLVGSAGGNIYVYDSEGSAVEGADIYTSSNVLLGTTDAEGKIFTSQFTSSVQSYSLYAIKDSLRSFIFTSQSYSAAGNADGSPTYIKANATENPSVEKNISWMASPLMSKADAIVYYAEKTAYDADGDTALQAFTGESFLSEMASSASTATNYAVRLNSALLTGLKPGTEYVYKVGDGVLFSDMRSFTTDIADAGVNFFVIGDTQATDTTNTSIIANNLAQSGTDFSFGIQTGDAVDNGGNYTMWSNIAKVFSDDYLGNIDLVQVLGNHEYYGDALGSAANAYYNLPNQAEDGNAPYYSVEYGNVYVAVINYTGIDGYKEAAEWLVQDAASSDATWKVLTMHQPAYYTNPSGGSPALTQVISNAVDAAGIDFVFSGHDHSYARTEPMTAGQVDKENGAVYYICGSTGEKSYEIIDNDAFNFAVLNGDYNAIYLTVTANDTTFDVTTHEYTADGQDIIIDSYTMTKDITCTDDGHDYTYADGWLTCSVCGYTAPVGTYTGLAHDAETGRAMYFIGGSAVKGWYADGPDYYYFDENGIAVTGVQKLDGYTYTFDDETGKLIKGDLVKEGNYYFYYIAGKKQRGWQMIDGYWYYFETRQNLHMVTGNFAVPVLDGNDLEFKFSSDGKLLEGAWYTTDTGTSYYWAADRVTGLQEIDGETYYFDPATTYMLVSGSVEIDGTIYSFGKEGTFQHYGEHIDENGDGNCDICKENSIFYKFLQRIIDFFETIIAFFKAIFGLIL